MKCKKCKRTIEDNSIFCNWCGYKQISQEDAIKVPPPVHNANGTWSAQLMVKGNRVRITAESEKEYYARARATKEGLIEAQKPDNKIVSVAVEEYIRNREGKISPATIDGYKRKAKSNLQSLYKLRIKELTTPTVQDAINKDCESYAGKTVCSAWSLISSATGVKLPNLVLPSKKPKKKPPTYKVEDIKKLIYELNKVGGQVECAALLAMWLSLRRSEIMGLKWDDIGESSIRIHAARVYDEHHQLVEKDNKTELSERTIPCDSYILSRLNALPRTGDNVFTISTSGIWTGINNACKKAGVPHGYLQGFRHTNATIMEYLGVPSLYANKRGGWANDHVRKNTYTDIMPEGDKAVADQIDAFFGTLTNESNPAQNPAR